MKARVALWKAIDRYVVACGGEPIRARAEDIDEVSRAITNEVTGAMCYARAESRDPATEALWRHHMALKVPAAPADE